MQYIILDMEWNQPWPGSYSAKKALPSPMRGEIVQIGAVRMTQEQQVADEFQILIRPKYFKKMNRKVASLTGIRDSLLREKGVSFPEAAAQFAAWCGEDCVFLTWGFDDITILRENLAVFGLESGWTARWYNAQLIFNAQTDGSGAQKALSTAMQMMDIAPTRAAHDALGDAYHTALVCQKLRLAEGIAAYEAAVQAHENGFHGAELPGCVQRAVFHGYADKTAALGAMSGQENLCPVRLASGAGQIPPSLLRIPFSRRHLPAADRAKVLRSRDGGICPAPDARRTVNFTSVSGWCRRTVRCASAGWSTSRPSRSQRAMPRSARSPAHTAPAAADSPASSQSRQNRKTDKNEGRLRGLPLLQYTRISEILL